MEKYPQAQFMPKPRGHDDPLKVEKTSWSFKSSYDWIEQNGLKPQKLNIYHVLAPNAYSYIEKYVPVLNKTVQSQIHERVMIQFPWHDGSIKNVHVDLATLYDFQKRLKSTVELFEKRIDWLSTGSRKIFGALSENSVVILIDLSLKNQNYLVHIQHSLRLLLEQQIPSKRCFNLIGFGGSIKRWKPTVVKPTPGLLQDAWRWVLQLTCEGTHDVMGALHAALENNEEHKHNIDVEGLYLFTSGMPDQMIDALCGYVEEKACGRLLRCHTILFNVDDYDINGPIPGRWGNIKSTAEALRMLAHSTHGGRFHWFRETGIIESDDISLLQLEIEKAVGFSRQAASLVDKIKRKDSKEIASSDSDEECCDEIKRIENKKAAHKPIMPPKPTALTLQRMALNHSSLESSERPKSIPWRPNSSKTDFLPLNQTRETLSSMSTKSVSSSKSKSSKIKTETFYIGDEGKNSKGIVVRTNSMPSKPFRGVPTSIAIKEKEENLTTKDWLKKYSLLKLKLDLNKLATGPECKHETISAGASFKRDSANRYCSIFPSVNINGTIRHLQLNQQELRDYQDQCEKALKRYVKRLQWLLSDSRRLFGTFVHERCAILVDTSGSMSDYLGELKRELSCLVWEQLYKNRISFNFIRFSDMCEKWRDRIVESSEENCHRAIAWIANLDAHGNTCTLDALREAFEDDDIDSIYLITDGKPDSSTTLVLDEVRKMNSHRNLSINAISFNCDDKVANEFLSQLAAENNGRYHRSSKSDREIHLFVHKILTEGVQDNYLSRIPEFDGDDLRRLTKEIEKAKKYLQQAAMFIATFSTTNNTNIGNQNRSESEFIETSKTSKSSTATTAMISTSSQHNHNQSCLLTLDSFA